MKRCTLYLCASFIGFNITSRRYFVVGHVDVTRAKTYQCAHARRFGALTCSYQKSELSKFEACDVNVAFIDSGHIQFLEAWFCCTDTVRSFIKLILSLFK